MINRGARRGRRAYHENMRLATLWVAVGGFGCWGPAPVPTPPTAGSAADTKISFPLVRPLDGSLLVTPVKVGTEWFLFELDPLAPRTRIDGDVVVHGEDDETASVKLVAGDVASVVDAELFDVRTIARDGFDIMGVLGRDVLRDDLVFGVDRDAGIAWLASPHVFQPPIPPVAYQSSDDRALVLGKVDGAERYLRIDFEDPLARVRRGPPVDPDIGVLLDHETVPVDQLQPVDVSAFGIERAQLPVAEYHSFDVKGVLGAAFFAPYDLALDRTNHQLYLAPRSHKQRTAAARIARWGRTPCVHLGCVEVSVGDDDQLHVQRDHSASTIALEVTLVATDLPDAPRLRVGLPIGGGEWHLPIDKRYAGHSLVVTDMSPFSRLCEVASDAGCVYVDEVTDSRRP